MCNRSGFLGVLLVCVIVGSVSTKAGAVPTVGFETDASGLVETSSPGSVNVVLSEPVDAPVTVDYAIAGGTATEGADYLLRGACGYDYDANGSVDSADLKILLDNWLADTPDMLDIGGDGAVTFADFAVLALEYIDDCAGILRFGPGQTIRKLFVDVINDGPDNDSGETIIVDLSNPAGGDAQLGAANRHTFTISDSMPEVSFVSESTENVEKTPTAADITVALSHASPGPVTVDYAIVGGTATGNSVDYLLRDGMLTFAPGQTEQAINLRLRNDNEIEDRETIELAISNPTNAKLGSITRHTSTILDDDAGVWFDDLHWFHSGDVSHLSVHDQGTQLEWDVNKGGQFITRIPAQSLSRTGDKVEVSYWWLSDGSHSCSDCRDCDAYCLDDDITCVAGTSDFRVGLFEADGEYITRDRMGTSNNIFEGYKGYNFRFGPNMNSGPNRWVDCTGEVHKTGNFAKKPGGSSSLMTANEGLEDYIDGFELPPGQWSLFTVSLERTSSSRVRMSITLNGRTQSYTDSGGGQPSKIDVFGVHMRNGRPYSRLVLSNVRPPSPID